MIAVVVAITFIRAIKCTIHYTTDYTLTNGVMILALAWYMQCYDFKLLFLRPITFENIYLQFFDNFEQNIFQNITQW